MHLPGYSVSGHSHENGKATLDESIQEPKPAGWHRFAKSPSWHAMPVPVPLPYTVSLLS